MRALSYLGAIVLTFGVWAACGDDGGGIDHDAGEDPEHDADPGALDAGIDADCYVNPSTHHEIINACTTAQKIEKDPALPLQLADGGLPPLP